MGKKNGLFGKIVKGAGVLAAAGAAVYGGILVKKNIEKSAIEVNIKNIAQSVSDNNTAVLNFREIVKEPWTAMHIFPAYTTYETIEDALGFNWDDVYKTNIIYKNDIDLLVFIGSGTVVRYIEYPKAYGDFSKLDKDVYEQGIFELSKEDNKISIRSISD